MCGYPALDKVSFEVFEMAKCARSAVIIVRKIIS